LGGRLQDQRESGVRGVLVHCSDYKCSHSITAKADQWPDQIRLSDLEPRFVCSACGKRGADIRPDFHWDKAGAAAAISISLPRNCAVSARLIKISEFFRNGFTTFRTRRPKLLALVPDR